MPVVSFYRFARVFCPDQLREELLELAGDLELHGTVLIAHEGINGTLTGPRGALDTFVEALRARPEFFDIVSRHTRAAPGNPVFHRLKVRVKREIVSFAQPGVDPLAGSGEHVSAERWNELLDDPGVAVIDARNTYEIGIGGFPGALDPDTTSFREFPRFVKESLDPRDYPRVAMYCTGGIRCEKASAFLLAEGFAEVYQLDGGILEYLENVSAEKSRWQGECFVFDQRVSVDAALTEGTYQQCFACRRPLSAEDLDSIDYRTGVSCAYCAGELSSAREAALTERNRQVSIAAGRGEQHIGATHKRRFAGIPSGENSGRQA
ncbi:MAG: rhodanese-related sulfurtransferase [Gammaproteobacteria bacterium]|nr:rhodanese-related sulfurtransferase [Gammaproteobacteria bacterium]